MQKKKNKPAPLCKCGCKRIVKWSNTYKRWNKYIDGHTWKGKTIDKKIVEKATKARIGLKRTEAFKKAQSKRFSGKNNPMYGKYHTKETKQKMSEASLSMSKETRRKISEAGKGNQRAKGLVRSPQFLKELSERMKGNKHSLGFKHTKETKKKLSIFRMGNQYAKGTIHTKEYKKEKSEYMKNGGAAYANSFIKNPSKPQVALFELVKTIYSEAILNYASLNFSIDIAIPDKMIAIEYDGSYWHKGREKEDKIRQDKLENIGWKFIRYVDYVPDINELEKDLKGVL